MCAGTCGTDDKNKYLIMRWLAAFAGVFGTFFNFVTAVKGFILINIPALALTCTAVCIVSCAVMSIEGKRGRTAEIVISALTALTVLITAKHVINGYSEIVTRFSQFLACDSTASLLISSDADTAVCVTAALTAMIVSFFTVRKPDLPAVVIFTFPLTEAVLYFGLVPLGSAFAALMICYAAVGAAMMIKDSSGTSQRAASQSALAAAAIMLCAVFAGTLWSAAAGRDEWADNLRERVINYFSTFTWEKFSDDVQTAFSAPRHELTHDGRLGSLDEVQFEGVSMIEVTAPADAPDVYIKGFTGTDYNGSRWAEGEPVPELKSKMTSPEFFSGRMLRYAPSFSTLDVEYIAVTNKEASPHTRYFPNNAAGLMESDGQRRQYWAYMPRNSTWQRVLTSEADSLEGVPDDMHDDERALREYAYKYCLDVPASFTAAEDFFEDYEGSGVYDEMVFIRYKLSQLCEYTLDSGRPPFGSDFAQWFLTENHKGSCTHFATTAVLLARSRGIPARYCEGFIVKHTDFAEGVKSGEYSTVNVPDSRAHAWAEIYIDGYGWMCFECTPGYGNMSSELPEISGDEVTESELTEVTTEAPEYTEDLDPETEASKTEASNIFATQTATETSLADNADVTTDIPSGETESHRADEPDRHRDKPKKPHLTEEQIGVICVIVFILSLVALIIAARISVFRARSRRIRKDPDRAAAEIYHMLLDIAKENGVVIEHTDDTTAEKLGKLFGKRDSYVITNTAIRARFAGGVTADEASLSGRAFKRIMHRYLKKKHLKRILRTLICKNKYT